MTKLEQLTRILREDIRKGKYAVGEKFPSEHELSEIYSANRITLNKAVSGLIREGYLARGASTRAGTIVKSGSPFPRGLIGFIVNMRDDFSANVATGAIKAALHEQYLLSLASPEADEIDETIRRMENSGFKGLISLHYGKLNTRLPTVHVDDSRIEGKDSCMSILSDSHGGGRLIAEKLIGSGHRDIAIFTKKGPEVMTSPRNRGVFETLKANGVPDVEARCFTYSEDSIHICIQTLKQMLADYPGLTAIACNTDHAAFNIIQAGKELGLEMPGRISVSGFGNVKSIRNVYSLLTINQHPVELGRRACEKLVEYLEGRKSLTPPTETLAVELIDGTSVKDLCYVKRR